MASAKSQVSDGDPEGLRPEAPSGSSREPGGLQTPTGPALNVSKAKVSGIQPGAGQPFAENQDPGRALDTDQRGDEEVISTASSSSLPSAASPEQTSSAGVSEEGKDPAAIIDWLIKNKEKKNHP